MKPASEVLTAVKYTYIIGPTINPLVLSSTGAGGLCSGVDMCPTLDWFSDLATLDEVMFNVVASSMKIVWLNVVTETLPLTESGTTVNVNVDTD